MSRPVNAVPPLPYPGRGVSTAELAAFDQDLVRALHAYLGDLARRANDCLPKDGQEQMTGPLSMMGFYIDIIRSITTTTQFFRLGPTDAVGHNITGFSPATNAKSFVFNVTTDAVDTAPSGGENSYSFNIRGVEKFRIDDSSNVSHFRHKVDIQDASGNILTRLSDDANGAIEIGKVNGSTSTPYIDFHSSATVADYNARIKCSGGSGTSGSGTLEFDADIVDLIQGQLKFPATQQASTDANTLDDYEEGSWTPVLTFSTPGDLSVAYTTQLGRYQKVGNRVTVQVVIQTSTFTHTTASGEMRITGLPFTSANITGMQWTGALEWGNAITPPGARTQVNINTINNVTYCRPVASGPGVNRSALVPADVPTATVVVLQGTLTYETTN